MRGKNTLSIEIRIPGERAGDKPSLLKKFGMILVNLYSLRNPNLARIFEYFKSKCNVTSTYWHFTQLLTTLSLKQEEVA